MSQLFPDYRPLWETDQHRELRKHAAEFLRKEATPHQERWVAQHGVDRDFWNKAGDAGHRVGPAVRAYRRGARRRALCHQRLEDVHLQWDSLRSAGDPIANMYTGSRVNRIYGGTSEIMKEIISRSL